MSEQTILCLTDFGRAGGDALRQAAMESQIRNARLHVLHVHECKDHESATLELCPKHQIESDLRVAAKSLDCDKFIECDRLNVEVRIGDAIEETLAAIKELGPDLVVVGTHQAKTTDGSCQTPQWTIGSYVEAVLTMTECPVLICRGPAKIGESVLIQPDATTAGTVPNSSE